jgi:hypothetical protein
MLCGGALVAGWWNETYKLRLEVLAVLWGESVEIEKLQRLILTARLLGIGLLRLGAVVARAHMGLSLFKGRGRGEK